MGLLDDAIREHMELKRLRGADPGEVARQERDALGPVVREHDPEGPALEDGEHGDHEDEGPNPAQDDLGNADPAHRNGNGTHSDSDRSLDPHPERGPDFANVGQETAELDMRTVLDEQLGEDALGQEPAIPGETPGQERLWFDQQQQAPRDFDFDP
jgi:hypothetical protein